MADVNGTPGADSIDYAWGITDADDKIYGLGGNDTIHGRGGSDYIYGGPGIDRLFGDDAADGFYFFEGDSLDHVDGGSGSDLIYLAGITSRGVILNLSTGLYNYTGAVPVDSERMIVDVENVNATKMADKIIGNDLRNNLGGNGGDDYIDGGLGADQMFGGFGNDTTIVDNADDETNDAVGGGSDTVFTKISYALVANQEIETFATTSVAGTTAINLTGNAFGQRINGNNGNNVIYGGAGNDLLVGYGGNDNLEGQAGADTLKGISGADKFVFRHSQVATSGAADHIADFGADDFIYFDHPSIAGPLNPVAFVAGANALDANDRFIYYAPYKSLYFDPDGNGAAAKVLFAVFDNGYTPTAADIVLF